MPEKQKPASDIVKKAAHFLKHPEDASLTDIKSMAARLMDDQRNDPLAHRPAAIKPKMKIAAAAPTKISAPVKAKAPAAVQPAAPIKAVKKSKAA